MCPICKRSTHWILSNARLDDEAMSIIELISPGWAPKEGICVNCFDRLSNKAAPVPSKSVETKIVEWTSEDKRLAFEYFRWIIGGIVMVIGFLMIRPQEQSRLNRELDLRVFEAYLEATNTENTNLWRRKLRLMKAFSVDKRLENFVEKEELDIRGIEDAKPIVLARNEIQTQLDDAEQQRKENLSVDSEVVAALDARIDSLKLELEGADKRADKATEILRSAGISPERAPWDRPEFEEARKNINWIFEDVGAKATYDGAIRDRLSRYNAALKAQGGNNGAYNSIERMGDTMVDKYIREVWNR